MPAKLGNWEKMPVQRNVSLQKMFKRCINFYIINPLK